MTEVYKEFSLGKLEVLESIRDQFWKSKKNNSVHRNKGGIHDEWVLGWPDKSPWWDNNPGFAEQLQANTYPFNEPIMNCWVKSYNTGEYSGLHTDDVNHIPSAKEYETAWTNSILIDQSPSIEGGDVVLAGDGFKPNFDEIKSRLITLRHKNIGDVIVWDSNIVHGVSRIEKGYRVTLVVIKERKNNG